MSKKNYKTTITYNTRNELDRHCLNILACVEEGQKSNFVKMAIYNYGKSHIAGLETRSSTIFDDDDLIL